MTVVLLKAQAPNKVPWLWCCSKAQPTIKAVTKSSP